MQQEIILLIYALIRIKRTIYGWVSSTLCPQTQWYSFTAWLLSLQTSGKCHVGYIHVFDSAPLHQTDHQQCQMKHGLLHHGQGNSVRGHCSCLNRNPQVFLSFARALFLLCVRPRFCLAAAVAASAVMATAAAVTAHQQSGEEDQEGENQEDHEADCVVQSLVVFVCHKAPNLVEEILDTVYFPIHGFEIERWDSLWVYLAAAKI